MNVLFVTWDGPQVSYLEGLFLPIFKKLQGRGIHFHVLQFTWGARERIALAQDACERAGMSYRAVRITRWPKAAGALLTAVAGSRLVRETARRHSIDVVMPRSTLPGLSAMLAARGGAWPIVFDADGLPLDERVDFAGQSPSSLAYRLLRDIEAQVVRRAAVVLTRSAKASDILVARAGAGTDLDKFFVVGNGRDADSFHPQTADIRSEMRGRLGIAPEAPLLVYAGSMGPQYCPAEMLHLFGLVRMHRPDARLLVLSPAADCLLAAMAASAVDPESVLVHAVEADQVPRYLACADLGIALRKRSFSMQAVAPIKLGEYLLCGVPVAATAGIGDTDSIGAEAGILFDRMDDAELRAGAGWFVDTVLPRRGHFRAVCSELGRARFSLGACVDTYEAALRSVPAIQR